MSKLRNVDRTNLNSYRLMQQHLAAARTSFCMINSAANRAIYDVRLNSHFVERRYNQPRSRAMMLPPLLVDALVGLGVLAAPAAKICAPRQRELASFLAYTFLASRFS